MSKIFSLDSSDIFNHCITILLFNNSYWQLTPIICNLDKCLQIGQRTMSTTFWNGGRFYSPLFTLQFICSFLLKPLSINLQQLPYKSNLLTWSKDSEKFSCAWHLWEIFFLTDIGNTQYNIIYEQYFDFYSCLSAHP